MCDQSLIYSSQSLLLSRAKKLMENVRKINAKIVVWHGFCAVVRVKCLKIKREYENF